MDDTVKPCYKDSLKVLKQACHYYSSDPGKASVLYFCSNLVTPSCMEHMMLMRSFPKTYDHIKSGENDRISICEECLIIIK